jgi:hypothetical protein
MPRLYGPGHFTEDPYSQVVSPHGIPVDDLVAVLQLGRGLMQWWDNGAQVRDELPSADHRYREELIEIHRRDEAENGTAPRPSRWASATAAPGCD